MEFLIFFNLRVLYPKFVQTFQIGPICTINFQGLASFRNNDSFKYIYIFFQNIQHKILRLEI